eukprot:4909952-Alexandrium_andersonii.AAC.1
MSASLVGSEMCIRDSSLPDFERLRAEHGCAAKHVQCTHRRVVLIVSIGGCRCRSWNPAAAVIGSVRQS